ncbi:hypothetical protein M0813_18592 [Anaeramoeba flamelloides]|uniref:Nucleolar complex protein 2 n=1 Tax=Anaeramoeba flamelloides TaxID=1746091 RepID=A0ABQ8YSQ7_9EUKA|nr:hypothetical protein M0813_18592 [Anaeramoeba flamelloides]
MFYLVEEEAAYRSALIFDKSYWELEKYILIYHYYLFLLESLNSSVIFTLISPKTKNIEIRIRALLLALRKKISNNRIFLKEKIFLGIASRSIKASTYYLFLFCCVMQWKETDISSFLDVNKNLIDKVNFLTKSKYYHVKNSTTIIWSKIIKNKSIRNSLVDELTKNPKRILQILDPKSNNNNSGNNNNNNNSSSSSNNNNNKNTNNANNNNNNNKEKKPLMGYFILILINKLTNICLKKINNNNSDIKTKILQIPINDLKFIILHYFKGLLKFCNWVVLNLKLQLPILDEIATTLEQMSNFFIKVRLQINNKKKNNNKNSNKDNKFQNKIRNNIVEMVISEANFVCVDKTIIKILFEILLQLNDSRIIAKEKFLLLIQNLLKDCHIFNEIKSNNNFFICCIKFFRINTNLSVIEKNWNLLYILIIYHQNAIDHLINTHILRSFVSLISTGSHINVASYGLKILYKLFNFNETKKMYNNATNDKIINKQQQCRYWQTQQSDIFDHLITNGNSFQFHDKFLNYFAQNSMFVNLNMLFQTYINRNKSRHKYNNSLILSNLARVYYIILSKNYCEIIRDKMKKKKQYIQGLNYFENLIFDTMPLKNKTSYHPWVSNYESDSNLKKNKSWSKKQKLVKKKFFSLKKKK